MINKNINNIINNGLNGLYDYPEINLKRIDYSYINDNNISSLKNEISLNKESFEYNDKYYQNLNHHFLNRVYSDKEKIKVFWMKNNYNTNMKIKSTSPISNNNKINQITIKKFNSNNAINKEDCPPYKKINENKIYNPYNTYNSYNKISDKNLKKIIMFIKKLQKKYIIIKIIK